MLKVSLGFTHVAYHWNFRRSSECLCGNNPFEKSEYKFKYVNIIHTSSMFYVPECDKWITNYKELGTFLRNYALLINSVYPYYLGDYILLLFGRRFQHVGFRHAVLHMDTPFLLNFISFMPYLHMTHLMCLIPDPSFSLET